MNTECSLKLSKTWGQPLTSHEVIVNLIANITIEAGLEIQITLDSGEYPIGIKISDKDMANLNLERRGLHGEWNYTFQRTNR